MLTNTSQNAKDALDKHRPLDQTAIHKVLTGIKVADVIAFDFKPCAVVRTFGQDHLDVFERVFEHTIIRAPQIILFPIIFELFEAVQHRE